MPRSVEELESIINEALTPGYRGRLVARGLARTMIWTDGELPEGAPKFVDTLTNDLLGYGLGLLRIALELRTLDRTNSTAVKAFERAAEAIEATVREGDPAWNERGFLTVVAAVAYHLGHFSARAFSLLAFKIETLNLSPSEQTLVHLIRRDFRALKAELLERATLGGFDQHLADTFEKADDDLSLDIALVLSLDSLFHKALAFFDFGIETGSNHPIAEALALLDEGIALAAEFSSVPLWWAFTITRHLIDDLWSFSFWVRLPYPKDDSPLSVWPSLRRLYISVLQSRSRSEIELWPSQLDAASRAVNSSDDLVAALPTSAGKTRIAEMCILRALSLQKRVVFVTPLRALSAQTERSLKETFVPLGFTVSSLYGSSGSTGDDVDSLKNRNIVVSTPEKLDFALRNDPNLIDDVGLIVFDEAHTVGAGEREVRYEVLVQRLLRRSDAVDRRIVCLSAILPHGEQLQDFVSWIRQDEPGDAITCDWRPTRQRFGEIVRSGNTARLTFRVEEEAPYVDDFVHIEEPTAEVDATPKQQFALASVWRLVEDKQTVLLYAPQRNWVIPLAKAAVELNEAGILPPLLSAELSDAHKDIFDDAINIGKEWLGSFHPAVQCLYLGVAVHHGQLPRPFLRAVERLLRLGILKVTIASPTLAQGLNLSATTLLLYTPVRAGRNISGEEFANVAGRAGRAFVDVEGRVLCLIDNAKKQMWLWEKLLRATRERDLRSGLFQLIDGFCTRIALAKGISFQEVQAYVLSGAASWQAPAIVNFVTDKPEKEQAGFEAQWKVDLACIDSALLSLVQQEVPIEQVAEEIDRALKGSLWERTLIHESDLKKDLTRALLVGRADFIWSNTTAAQRKGYFFAGLSYETGRFLDENSQILTFHLELADALLGTEDLTGGIDALINFAEIVFLVDPFTPDKLRNDWKELLKLWISGDGLSDLTGNKNAEIVEFIEGCFVYRLVWALEAVRVRNSAHSIHKERNHAGRSALAVETGTSQTSMALLIQAGFPSRTGATQAIRDCPASFTDLKGMRAWIFSDVVKERQKNADWPTSTSHRLWTEFVSSLHSASASQWKIQTLRFTPEWLQNIPEPGTNLRIIVKEETGTLLIYSAAMDYLGRIVRSLKGAPSGQFFVRVSTDAVSIDGEYLGPDDLHFV